MQIGLDAATALLKRFKSCSCKANWTFSFASRQVWSERRMQTTSSDLFHEALPRERTSQHLPTTSHTSSTRATGTTRQRRAVVSRGWFGRDPRIEPFVDHTDTVSPKVQRIHRQTLPTPQLMKIITGAGGSSKVASMAITWVMITIMMTRGKAGAASAGMTTTAVTGRSRGSTSAGEGRNVCKGNFSF